MTKESDPKQPSAWRTAGHYESMLALDSRAMAWQCLRRDPAFSSAAASVRLTNLHIVRPVPRIFVARLPADNPLTPWGLYFRRYTGPMASGTAPILAS
ncbi:transcriptional regulator domain-containing protein [Nitrospirillum viridazoti]|uniref:transcriptional regulator domain-containing protein n=1 Tax=Nitrospirillum viridazoti TaxID=3144925 RepID=UPI003CE45D9B